MTDGTSTTSGAQPRLVVTVVDDEATAPFGELTGVPGDVLLTTEDDARAELRAALASGRDVHLAVALRSATPALTVASDLLGEFADIPSALLTLSSATRLDDEAPVLPLAVGTVARGRVGMLVEVERADAPTDAAADVVAAVVTTLVATRPAPAAAEPTDAGDDEDALPVRLARAPRSRRRVLLERLLHEGLRARNVAAAGVLTVVLVAVLAALWTHDVAAVLLLLVVVGLQLVTLLAVVRVRADVVTQGSMNRKAVKPLGKATAAASRADRGVAELRSEVDGLAARLRVVAANQAIAAHGIAELSAERALQD